MNKLCIVCYRWQASRIPKICDDCCVEFVAGNQDEYSISLYHYQTVLRDLVRRAKIQGDMPAISLLIFLFLDAAQTTSLATWADVIMPAPSSLWGRLRGKLDIAFALASQLARVHGKPLQNSPHSLYWRLKKRSQQQDRGRGYEIARNPPNALGYRRILLVDDVLTTGQTLHEIAAFFPDDSIKFLTLASAAPG